MRPRHPMPCLDARPTPSARQASASRLELAVLAALLTTAGLGAILLVVLHR